MCRTVFLQRVWGRQLVLLPYHKCFGHPAGSLNDCNSYSKTFSNNQISQSIMDSSHLNAVSFCSLSATTSSPPWRRSELWVVVCRSPLACSITRGIGWLATNLLHNYDIIPDVAGTIGPQAGMGSSPWKVILEHPLHCQVASTMASAPVLPASNPASCSIRGASPKPANIFCVLLTLGICWISRPHYLWPICRPLLRPLSASLGNPGLPQQP